jgi:uncharacterized protein (TIGR00369 family)
MTEAADQAADVHVEQVQGAAAGSGAAPRREFYETLGLEVISVGEGMAIVEMASAVGFRNSRGELHGGALLSIADIAASIAVRSRLGPGAGVATISLTMNFTQPAAAPARAVARVTSLGGKVAFAQVDVESNGEVVAQGVASIRLFRKPRAVRQSGG